jgi:tetratricopeptide (TPR) repeat protein
VGEDLTQDRVAAPQPNRNVAALLQKALSHHQGGRLGDARKLYEQVLRIHPKSHDALNLLGLIVAAEENAERGMTLIRRAIALFPQFPEALNNLGVLLLSGQRPEEALVQFDRAIALRPSYAEAFNNRGNALHSLNRNEEALLSCDKAITLRPAYAEAFNNRGITLHSLERDVEALASYDKAIALHPAYAEAFNNRGTSLHSLNRDQEALVNFDEAITLRPIYAEAFNNRGVALHGLKRDEEALVNYDKALALRPTYAEAFNNRGTALHCLHRDEEALASYDKAIALQPAYAEAVKNLGTTLRRIGRFAGAETAFRRALELNPRDYNMLNQLALVIKDLERLDEAAALLDLSMSLDPRNAKTHIYVALLRLAQNRTVDAEAAVLHGLDLAADDPEELYEALIALGMVRFDQHRAEEALEVYTRALVLMPDRAEACNNIGNIHREDGNLAEAREAYERSIEIDPREAMYYLNLADTKTFSEDDAHIAAMEERARDVASLSTTSQRRLNFALAKAYDDVGRYDQAFRCLAEGNALKRGQIDYDEIALHNMFDRVRATFDRKLMESKACAGYRSALPVFVVGMPRSGTTLVEQILASHPSVYGAGELPHLTDLVERMGENLGNSGAYPENVAALSPKQLIAFGELYVERLQRLTTKAERITDKMPANFMFLGLVHLVLPDARIIHVSRDPLDTCLSCFSTLFAVQQYFTYDLGELGRYYRKYAELMGHWRSVLPPGRILDVRYENVIADLETEARQILDYCGLLWHPSCIAFHEARRPVRTASASQVRRPLYRTSEGRWRAYRDHLGPLLAALGELVDASPTSDVLGNGRRGGANS